MLYFLLLYTYGRFTRKTPCKLEGERARGVMTQISAVNYKPKGKVITPTVMFSQTVEIVIDH